jgi:deoxycytidine triphosphate deaminase
VILSGKAILKRLTAVAPISTPSGVARVKEAIDEGKIVISPFPDISEIPSTSLTLEIGKIQEPLIPSTSKWICVDFSQPETRKEADRSFRMFTAEKFYLHPGVHNFARVTTKQFIGIPNDLLGLIAVKEEFKKYGLGLIGGISIVSPGFMGEIELDIINSGNRPIVLSLGLPLFQLVFELLSNPVISTLKKYAL